MIENNIKECLFCKWKEESKKNILENELAFARFDEFAVSKGHMLFLTKRHAKDFFSNTFEYNVSPIKFVIRLLFQFSEFLSSKSLLSTYQS